MSLFTFRRLATTSSSSTTNSQPEKKAQAAQLALQSLKDVGSLLSPSDPSSSSSSDDATQPIDTSPIYANPQLFPHLSLLHQGQVVAELQSKYDKNWHKLQRKDKLLGYYISYGNWGVREHFTNWSQPDSAPLDLPFRVPSEIRKVDPAPTDVVKPLEMVKLSETPVRIDQFDYKKMDPATKFCIYLIVFIAMVAIYRDKNVGEDGKPVEVKIEDQYEIARQREEQERVKRVEEEERRQRESRKWYYLWLR
ncbi:hypothetical protein KGF57_000015 [Candida theae]|uniref:Genetic interactor of prohibitin 7, mitochondrial n=1 Tax=Candida theae TaxID=1198502 RepID=A0AAD5BJN6_9ASCO|nr:uncharacterized protein KGF57_000015 [Candida theae]KAI5968900.1 hypothetical protein KGF57_000015 [Candida theae]